MAASLKELGFTARYPIACINSMGGCQLKVEKSDVRPGWQGRNIVLDLSMVTEGFLTNNLKVGTGNEWKTNLKGILDGTEDNQIDIEDLVDFIDGDELLKLDPQVLECLEHAKEAATHGGNLLSAFEPVKAQLSAATERQEAETGEAEGTPHAKLRAGIGDNRVMAKAVYAQHMELVDGWKDPAGIKVRAVKQKDSMASIKAMSDIPIIRTVAALFGGTVTALEEFGYVAGKNMRAFPYDWRCALTKLEERDSYFSELMKGIEELVAANGERCVVTSHSMGQRIAHYFLLWVTDSEYGKRRGGQKWLDKYVHSFMPIAGLHLGAESGIEQHLQPGAVMGLCPAVLSPSDGLAMIRSLGSVYSLWSSGKGAMLSGGSHYFFTRREGALQIELLGAKIDGCSDDEATKVHFQVSGVRCGLIDAGLESAVGKGSAPTFNSIFQFAWPEEPEAIDGRTLQIKLIDDNLLIDTTIAQATISLSATGGVEGSALTEVVDGTVLRLTLGEWASLKDVKLGHRARLTLRVKWVPSNAPIDPRYDVGEGAPGLGGTADAGTSEAKKKALESAGLKEWVPTGSHPYDPRTTEEMLALEDLPDLFEGWRKLCADDPIYVKMAANVAPGIKLCSPIYGINCDSDVGAIFRRVNAVWQVGGRLNYFTYDEEAKVETTGYKAVKGVVRGKPGQEPQATDPWSGEFGKVFKSGDGTVPYWSLRGAEMWAKDGVNVNIVEIEGAGHRSIHNFPADHFAVLMHLADEPDVKLKVSRQRPPDGPPLQGSPPRPSPPPS